MILVFLDSLILLLRIYQTSKPNKQHTAAKNAGELLLCRAMLWAILLVRVNLAFSGKTKERESDHIAKNKIAHRCLLSLWSGWLQVIHPRNSALCSYLRSQMTSQIDLLLMWIIANLCLLLSVRPICYVILFVLSFLIGAFVIDGTVEDGALEGKLSCIHCGARLGYFNWSGIQCNCGSWITPAFQISKSKVDISTT